MKNHSLLDGLKPDYVVQLVRDTVEAASRVAAVERQTLDESLWDFLSRNHKPFSALANNQSFLRAYPGLASELFRRAIEAAQTPEGKEIIAQRALAAGLPLVEDDSAKPWRIFGPMTRSQAAAYRRLRALVELHFRGPPEGGVHYRTAGLLIGSTGVGKTSLVERLADSLGIDFLRLTVGNWVVAGARADTATLRLLHRRVRSGNRLLLAIDELDKLGNLDSTWSQSILVDLFGCLDRSVVGGDWTDDDRENLRRNVAVVGCGTWDSIWRQQDKRAVGFNGEAGAGAPFDIAAKIQRESPIPRELVNRFASPWLIIEPLGSEDFRQIARDLNLPAGVLDPEKAAASGLGYRAVENAVTDAALIKILQEQEAEAHLSGEALPHPNALNRP